MMDKVYFLKSNGHIILNFVDLQEHFSPWEFLTQKRSFEKFAKIHCLPLTTWVKDKNGGKTKAKYFNKKFWMEVLNKDWDSDALDDEKSAYDYIYDLSNLLHTDILEQEATDAKQKELELLCIQEKINFICNESGLTQSKDDKITVALLLALCELAEFDAREQNFQRWVQNSVTENNENYGEDCDEEPNDIIENTPAPESFPNGSKLTLNTSAVPYRFFYHESGILQSDVIKTVRIEAVDGNGAKVIIELCRESGEVYDTVEMITGEYRDCNVSAGKIIRFLPTLSISDTLCIARKDYCSSDITIMPRDAMEWTLSIDSSIAKKITSFAAGDNETEGFLCIRDGKLMRGFYKPNDNYKTRQRFDMIKDRLVEVRLFNGYYELLTEGGKVISDNSERNGLRNVVTLYPRNRQDLSGVREVAYSVSGRSRVEHKKITEECEVNFE